MTVKRLTTQQLYDHLLIGLYYLRIDRPTVLRRPGNSVLRALRSAGVLQNEQYKRLLLDVAFATHVQMGSELVKSRYCPNRPTVRSYATAALCQLVVLIFSAEMLNHRRLYGPNGYPLC